LKRLELNHIQLLLLSYECMQKVAKHVRSMRVA